MTYDYKQLCAELVDSIELLLEMRQVKARPLRITEEQLYRARAALADPEPEGPTDEELDAKWGLPAGTVASWGAKPPSDVAAAISRQLDRDIARAVLARWSNHPGSQDSSMQPIPVSERLPGPEDCDAESRCWWYGEGGDMVGWTYQDLEGLSYYKSTHWLPADALLQPS